MTAHEPGRIYDAFIGFNDTSRQKERLAAHAQEHGITPSQALRDALWHFLGPDMERGEEWPSGTYVGLSITEQQHALLMAYARANGQTSTNVLSAAFTRFFEQEGVEHAPKPRKALKKPLRRA